MKVGDQLFKTSRGWSEGDSENRIAPKEEVMVYVVVDEREGLF